MKRQFQKLPAVAGALIIIGVSVRAQSPAPEASNAASQSKAIAVLLDPRSDAQAILYDAFVRSGHPPDEAGIYCAKAVGKPAGMGVSSPIVCLAEIIYCDKHGRTRRRLEWLNSAVYDGPNGDDGLKRHIRQSPVCPSADHVPWLKLTTANDAMGLPDGTCVRLRLSDPQGIPGVENILQAVAFRETNPFDKSKISVECCSAEGGCTDACPDCS